MLSIIAVIGKNRELGKNNKLLWHIPGDLPRFKKFTTGHPIIMGRKTFESIGTPLSDRTNIVISSHNQIKDVTMATSIDQAIEIAKESPGKDEIFVIGGGQIFEQTIGLAERLYLTLVEQVAEADTFFPDYTRFSTVVSKEPQEAGGYQYSYIVLEPPAPINSSTAPIK